MEKRFKSSRAYALVIVLFAIVLCALMVIILMERGTLGIKSAAAYSQGMQVRTLSDMVQSLVQAQIYDATTLNQTPDTLLANRDTWASQPGAIRVYSNNGDLREIYKLYSSDHLTTTDPNLAEDVPSDWHTRPSEYTDLNAPVQGHYPIVDPNAKNLIPGATGIADGFSISEAPVASGGNQAPMPVRWIYVLQDGSLCQLGDSRINRNSNPIVGRIAFWTDDETAKVNINTAAPVSINSFWDVPRTGSSYDRNTFGWKQPAQDEYQRYPGHPAMVSLRAIMGNLGLSDAAYYKLTPRYYYGGSADGTLKVSDNRTSLLLHKEDRAYTSVDELLFRSLSDGTNDTRQTPPSPEQVEGLHFFASASSRAPELNLFGQPRVTLWPIFGNPDHADPGPTRRTPFDELIAFCSTIGGKPYYFTREDPLSPTHDYESISRNQQLYQYLQNSTSVSVPGFPGTSSFASKYGVQERDQILTEIFDYIRIINLNETYKGRDPGFQSYTSDWRLPKRDGAETMINTTADYPATGELRGAGMVVPIEIGTTRGMGRFPAIAEIGLMFVTHSEKKNTDANSVPPAPDPANHERLEAMLVMDTITPAHGYMPWIGKNLSFRLTHSDLKMRVGDREVDLFPSSMYGLSHIKNPQNYEGGEYIHWPSVLRGGFDPGGYDGAFWIYGQDAEHMSANAAYTTGYRFYSPPIDLVKSNPSKPTDDTEFSVTGGTLSLDVVVGDTVVQSYTFQFPDIPVLTLPVRRDDKDFQSNYTNAGNPYGQPWWRSRFWGGEDSGPFENDILHSLELKDGDARLIAGNKNVPASAFVPHPDYTKNQRFAHGMRVTRSNHLAGLWIGTTLGTYVNLPLYTRDTPPSTDWRIRDANRPKISSRISDLRAKGWSGDFDNGMGNSSDGPFINKSDEGMMDSSSGFGSTDPYYGWRWSLANGLFSPLRQIPSAVMLGSLPTGVKSDTPWQTLLFCANPRDPDHKGFQNPADYLLLDLFRMPVVEPYAISGPASTDGKINMNYAIVPFSYIRRASSWYALLEPLKFLAIPDADSEKYKGPSNPANYWTAVNIPETLKQFDNRFATHDIFRSPTEICSLFLVPTASSLGNVSNFSAGFWSKHRLTGDNSREKPYAELYPKLTTQSNTYLIHMRVQVLPPSDAVPAGKEDFEPLAEYQGSRLIERYLNANDARFYSSNPAHVDPDKANLNALYQYRVLETRQFTP